MTYKFVINGTLPNLNDYLASERVSFRTPNGKFTTKGNQMKKKSQDLVILQIRQCLGATHINVRVRLKYSFYEPNMKRDKDNIASFGMKIIQDSLVLAKIIDNDGWKNIDSFECNFYVDKEHPRIEVEIIELESEDN